MAADLAIRLMPAVRVNEVGEFTRYVAETVFLNLKYPLSEQGFIQHICEHPCSVEGKLTGYALII